MTAIKARLKPMKLTSTTLPGPQNDPGRIASVIILLCLIPMVVAVGIMVALYLWFGSTSKVL